MDNNTNSEIKSIHEATMVLLNQIFENNYKSNEKSLTCINIAEETEKLSTNNNTYQQYRSTNNNTLNTMAYYYIKIAHIMNILFAIITHNISHVLL